MTFDVAGSEVNVGSDPLFRAAEAGHAPRGSELPEPVSRDDHDRSGTRGHNGTDFCRAEVGSFRTKLRLLLLK